MGTYCTSPAGNLQQSGNCNSRKLQQTANCISHYFEAAVFTAITRKLHPPLIYNPYLAH
ncbi:MAG: hypothetical protein AB1847_02825 [bacterium]